MATFKACVKTQGSDGLFAVLIRISHNRTARYINTGKTIDKSKVRKGEIKDATILSYCSNLINLISIGFNRNTHYRNVCYDTANLQIKLSFLQKQKCIIHFVALKTIKGKTLVLPFNILCSQRLMPSKTNPYP